MTADARGLASNSGSRDVSLAVVIPSRNRPDLAIAACSALLAQPGDRHQVFVSDNSTGEADIGRLAEFCRTTRDPRLVLLRPPVPLTMPAHWDWAIQQAMEQSAATHFTVHYDRKVTKPGAIDLLLDVLRRFPDTLVTHPADHVADAPPPATLWQAPWTGKIYAMRSARVVELSARCMIDEMGHAFPILSNCLVPRSVLLAIREQFGSVCDSTGPDSCFTYRFCALNEGYLHIDWPTAVLYAPQRSNGLGYLRGAGGDFSNFIESWGERPWLEAAPIPGLNLGQNMLYHEYELVRLTAAGASFPRIDMPAYLARLADALHWIQDPRVSTHAQRLLEAHGSSVVERPLPKTRAGQPDGPSTERASPSSGKHSLVSRVRARVNALRHRQGVALFLNDYLGIKPEHITGFTFANDRQALRYALACPRRRVAHHPYLEPLQPREVAAINTSESITSTGHS